MTARQSAWAEASDRADREGNTLAAGLFALLSLPNEQERSGHACRSHAVGFRTGEGRRGFRCGICRKVVRWIDGEVSR
jgi:hypothetical protein